MKSYEQFDATHRVLAFDDDRVAVCKSDLITALGEVSNEFRVGIHVTEHGNVPDEVARLGPYNAPETGSNDEEMTWLVGKLPEDAGALQSLHNAMGDDGSLPVSTVAFHGETFDGLVTASTSHSHIGKLCVREPSSATAPLKDDFVDDLNEALENHGLVVPATVIAAWEYDGKYFELTGSELCVYAERVEDLSGEERMSVTHHCHDLTALQWAAADTETEAIELSWEVPDSLTGRAVRRIFGAPPSKLRVSRSIIPEVDAHLSRFVE